MITIGTATSLPVEDTRAADTGGAMWGRSLRLQNRIGVVAAAVYFSVFTPLIPACFHIVGGASLPRQDALKASARFALSGGHV